MKLLKLSITNIASIQSAEIDFTAQPLASAPVYLITGNTGAGKTTILDSICLALYGTTPRLQRLAEGGHKSIETADGNKYTDSRSMARRDSAEACAELKFVGNDGIKYTATWSTARAYKKLDRPFRTPFRTLMFTESGRDTVIDRISPLNERIERAVGLDFKKFCRTTMLAQGDFTRFLQAPNDEKSEILEKITGTDVYRRISVKIRENYKARKDAANELQQQLANIVLMSADELQAAAGQLKELEDASNRLTVQSASMMKQIMWLENDATLTKRLAELQTALTEAEAAANSEAIAGKKTLVAQYEITEQPRQWHSEATKAEAEKTKAAHDLEELAAHALDLRGGLEHLRLSIANNQKKSAELNALIALEQPNSEIYGREQLVAAKLQSLVADRCQLASLNAEISRLEKSIHDSLQKEVERAAAGLASARSAQAALQQSVDDLEAILEAKHPDRIREVLESLKLEKLKVERRQQIVKLQNEIAQNRAALPELTATLANLRLARDKAKATYEHERESVDALIRKLRGELTPGCQCPLCRQTVNVVPVEQEIELLIVGYEQAYRQADEAVKKHEADINRLTATIEVAQKSIAAEETGLSDPLRSLEAVDAEIASVGKLLDEINALSQQIREGRNQLKAAAGKTEQCAEAYTAASAKLAEADTLRASLKGRLAAVNLSLQSLEAEILSLTDGYRCDLSPLKKPEEYGAMLSQAAKSYSRAVDTLAELNRHIQTSQEEFTRNMAIIDSLGLPCDSPVSPIRLNSLDVSVSALNAKVAATRRTIADSDATISRARKQIAEFLAGHAMSDYMLDGLLKLKADEVAGARRDIAAASDNMLRAATALNEERKRYEAHLANRPETLTDEPVDQLKARKAETDREAVKTNRQIGVITQQLNADGLARKTHAERLRLLDEKRADEERWRKLDDLFGDTTGRKFVNIAQTYVLMDLIESANKYMATLTDRYLLRVEPNSFVIYVDDAFDGGTSRPANTISGGESFLISLALALALSDIAEGLEVDTLFIDEGFGTLSGKPLKDAIATLSQLHSRTGRHIGIISHVEELRNELPVQIRVVHNPHSSASRVEVLVQ